MFAWLLLYKVSKDMSISLELLKNFDVSLKLYSVLMKYLQNLVNFNQREVQLS